MPIVLNPGIGGNTLNSDLAGGLDTQIVKIGISTPGVAPSQVSMGNPLPVQGTVAVSGIAGSVAISGAVQVSSLPAVTGTVSAELQDGAGNPITSVTTGAQKALAVSIIGAGGIPVTSFGGSGGTADQDATAFTRGTSTLTPIGAVVDAAPPALTAGNVSALSLDTNGNLRVNLDAGGAVAGTAGSPSTDVLTIQGATGMVPITTASSTGNRFRVTAAAGTNATLVSAAAKALVSYALFNNASTPRYLHFSDGTVAPTPGTTAVAFVLSIPSGGGMNCSFDSGGIPFTGLAYTITAGIADNDTTAVAANDVTGVIVWK